MSRSRRTFLTTLAAAGVTLPLAGCTGSDDGSDASTEAMTESMTAEDAMTEGDGESMGAETDAMDEEMTESMDSEMSPTDPGEAPRASIDRFSDSAGMLHRRSQNDALPGPDEPIDFDSLFLTQGYGPGGDIIEYYDFDVQSTQPAPIYALFYENGDPVEGQLNIIDVIPGDEGYNDFWQVHLVTVPDDYEANTVTSVQGIQDAGFDISPTSTVKNCPIVPDGSTASMRHSADKSPASPVEGWYEGEVVSYFLFEEASLSLRDGSVPLSPIYVSFNTNPGEDGGGPTSGFMSEEGNDQTHNVTATVPGDDAYSPLWSVNIYDNADFDTVSDLDSASSATVLNAGAATVNCPVVSEQ
ncbi:hypothetical protein JZX76_05020 [Haloarcula hispanica]|uniref:Uncharacterized protein n=1 Tax=Haloarcula hispanica TaxID=51589 RepID=A0A482T8Y4_HALHI|nr:twin-arginine translocation signal domain-containing protein [Haloarcula hispanica]MCJ0618902.1 hypothetical protein [Haloarcula hispanica]RYJ09447.1 hypothetical protein ELS20_05010 [Haloarcula hispanica]